MLIDRWVWLVDPDLIGTNHIGNEVFEISSLDQVLKQIDRLTLREWLLGGLVGCPHVAEPSDGDLIHRDE